MWQYREIIGKYVRLCLLFSAGEAAFVVAAVAVGGGVTVVVAAASVFDVLDNDDNALSLSLSE